MHAAAVNGKLAEYFFDSLYKFAKHEVVVDKDQTDICSSSIAGLDMDRRTKGILGFCCGEPWTLESAKARGGVSRT